MIYPLYITKLLFPFLNNIIINFILFGISYYEIVNLCYIFVNFLKRKSCSHSIINGSATTNLNASNTTEYIFIQKTLIKSYL